MSTTFMPGLGTTLSRASAVVAQAVELDGPEASVEKIDTTHLGTTGGMTNRPSALVDGGELSGKLWYHSADTTHTAMYADLQAGTISTWKLTFTTGAFLSFNAWVKSVKPTGIKIQENIQLEFTLVVSGTITPP